MSFSRANSATVGYRKRQNASSTGSGEVKSGSGILGIVNRSRLTDEDLERFRLSIIEAHKKKHYKSLAIFCLSIMILGVFLFYFVL